MPHRSRYPAGCVVRPLGGGPARACAARCRVVVGCPHRGAGSDFFPGNAGGDDRARAGPVPARAGVAGRGARRGIGSGVPVWSAVTRGRIPDPWNPGGRVRCEGTMLPGSSSGVRIAWRVVPDRSGRWYGVDREPRAPRAEPPMLLGAGRSTGFRRHRPSARAARPRPPCRRYASGGCIARCRDRDGYRAGRMPARRFGAARPVTAGSGTRPYPVSGCGARYGASSVAPVGGPDSPRLPHRSRWEWFRRSYAKPARAMTGPEPAIPLPVDNSPTVNNLCFIRALGLPVPRWSDRAISRTRSPRRKLAERSVFAPTDFAHHRACSHGAAPPNSCRSRPGSAQFRNRGTSRLVPIR